METQSNTSSHNMDTSDQLEKIADMEATIVAQEEVSNEDKSILEGDDGGEVEERISLSKEDISLESVKDTLKSTHISSKESDVKIIETSISKEKGKNGNADIPISSKSKDVPVFTKKSHIWTTPKSRHMTASCFLCNQLLGIGSNTTVKKCRLCQHRAHDDCVLNKTDKIGCLRTHEIFIKDDKFKESRTPLIVFINPKSGAQLGNKLMMKLQNLLGVGQVFNLSEGGPVVGLEKFRDVPNLKILVAGGDGTVSWVLETITKLGFPYNPPVAILPLGTGNDLARQFGWGGGYTGSEKLSSVLNSIRKSKVSPLDRWKINFIRGDVKETKIMNNYFSIGADAEIAVGFHTKRNTSPELFNSRIGNKLWYVYYGSKSITRKVPPLYKMIEIEVDGERVELPKDLSGLIITNLRSYASGIDLWGDCSSSEAERLGKRPSTPRCDDGILEIVGLRGTIDVGTMASGIMKPYKIAQAISVSMIVKSLPDFPDACVQMDGEPWREKLPFTIRMCIMDHANLLYNPQGDPFRKKRSSNPVN